MSTTDTDALTERIADALAKHWKRKHSTLLTSGPCSGCSRAAADAVAAEVRKAKAEALREAALQYGPGQLTGMFSRDGYTRAWLQARATEYETGDQR